MEKDRVLQQRDWSEQEFLENGFRYFERRKYVFLARELPPEEAPLKMYYENDTHIATAGYMICFSAGWRKRKNLYDYPHWPVAPDHFADMYREWDDPNWKPNRGEKHLMSLGCKPYYNAVGVWAKKLRQSQLIQSPEHESPFEVPAGTWLLLGAKGSTKGVSYWNTDKGFKRRFIIK
ncbi:hypothetical protein ANAEL_00893 [Anaerolineales bacterium]|nr:hypothetical protein ANAEL_00893 [Anaerolineales bacterium]